MNFFSGIYAYTYSEKKNIYTYSWSVGRYCRMSEKRTAEKDKREWLFARYAALSSAVEFFLCENVIFKAKYERKMSVQFL